MDATIGSQIAALRADRGVLKDRLSELDEKLARWLTEMQAAQAVVVDWARSLRDDAESGQPSDPVVAEEQMSMPIKQGGRLFVGQATSLAEVSPPPDVEVTIDGADPAPGPKDDDAALLESLDPQTANEIRVKRRLTGGRRSVRELLEEIQAKGSTADRSDTTRTRWWRRRHE